jgi:hypothetical protein
MGQLDDAIREHLELKRRRGAAAEEIARQEAEALSPVRRSGRYAEAETDTETEAETASPTTEAEPAAEGEDAGQDPPVPDDPVAGPAVAPPVTEPEPAPPVRPTFASEEPWLDEPDEVPSSEVLDHKLAPAEPEDLLEDTPDFLQETPEHDRLWFEQKPPRDFDFDR